MQLTNEDRETNVLSSGRMSPECLTPTMEHSVVFSGRCVGKKSHYNLQGVNGRTLVWCMDPKEPSDGESLTHNSSEWHNDADVCLLSQVLEKGLIPSKYYLSPKACAGILRRAEQRGKKLPEMLRIALESTVNRTQFGNPLERSDLINRGGHEGARVAVNTTGAGFWQEGFGTLRAREQESHEHLICGAHSQGNNKWPAEITCTLNAHYGDKQGLENQHALNGASLFVPVTQYGTEQAGTLTARHDSSPCSDRGMNVIAFKPGQSADSRSIGAQEEIACTLKSGDGGNNKQAVAQNILIRRLTPMECERLQGMPDNHTNIPGAADGPRYKAIGNSMAVPCISWLGKRLGAYLNGV